MTIADQTNPATPDAAPRHGWNNPPVVAPRRRRLRVFAFDPMTSRLSGDTLTIDVPMESLSPGPVGKLIQVVDFHPPSNTWFQPVDLDDPAVIHQDGLRPAEGDPRSHQQMVYAVASSLIERFERFLGRRFSWTRDARLVLIPHAFEGSNAFFDPDRKAVLFGYFRASRDNPGRNLPGQTIFTCLSLDIVAHEVTHALVHRLRRSYSVPTNPDVLAWHEAFADLVALFHHFVFPDVVREAVAKSRGDLVTAGGLFDLAAEFGESTGRGAALRSAIKSSRSKAAGGDGEAPQDYREAVEPHERGAIFVSAVFDAYVRTYQRNIADLLRIASGGTGVLPDGHLHPDLVKRVASEAVTNADRYLGMVVRAFDYLPVVDPTFGDVVRAIVTADRDLHPNDELRLRSTLVEAFRRRGIYPDDATSLAEEGLVLSRPLGLVLSPSAVEHLNWLVALHAKELDPIGDPTVDEDAETVESEDNEDGASSSASNQALAGAILSWARGVAAQLGFEPDRDAGALALAGRHVSFRRAEDRQPQPEIVLQITQRRREFEDQTLPEKTRPRVVAGTTLIVTMTGEVRYIVPKPLPRSTSFDPTNAVLTQFHEIGTRRLQRLRESLRDFDDGDVTSIWVDADGGDRIFQQLHLTGDTEVT